MHAACRTEACHSRVAAGRHNGCITLLEQIVTDHAADPQPAPKGPYLTVEQVAARYQVSRSLVYAWCRNGGVPVVRLGARLVRIPEDGLHDAVAGLPRAPVITAARVPEAH